MSSPGFIPLAGAAIGAHALSRSGAAISLMPTWLELVAWVFGLLAATWLMLTVLDWVVEVAEGRKVTLVRHLGAQVAFVGRLFRMLW